MKTLITAAAIVCAAAFAKAASCSWDTEWVFAVSTDNPTYTGETETSSGYFWILALTDASVANSIKVNVDGIISYNTGATLYGEKGNYSNGAVAGSVSGLSAANNGDYYALVVFDKNYQYYGVATAQVAGIVDEDLGANPPVHGADGAMRFENYNDGYSNVWANTAATPEPTSGLLILLGVAGLALKRKHA